MATPKKPQILVLYESWTDEQKKIAQKSMTLARTVELITALLSAGYSASDLRSAGYSASALRSAGYSASDLRRASYSASDVLSAGYSASALRRAGYSASALLSASYSASDLLSAGYSASALRRAGYSASDVLSLETSCKEDVQAKAKKMDRDEAAFVAQQLRLGLLDGSTYGAVDSCGCFLGTAARAAGKTVSEYCQFHGIKKDGSSPAEKWFMDVSIGDTPENNYAAQKGVEWIEEVLA